MAERHPDCTLEPGSEECLDVDTELCDDCPWWDEEMGSGDWEEVDDEWQPS